MSVMTRKIPTIPEMAAAEIKRPGGGPWLTLEEAARYVAVSPQTIKNWRASKDPKAIPAYRAGRALWFRERDLEAWIERHMS